MLLVGTTVQDVIETMRVIEAALPEHDGVRWFNLLYRQVTQAVQADASWADCPFSSGSMWRFAMLYFGAIIA